MYKHSHYLFKTVFFSFGDAGLNMVADMAVNIFAPLSYIYVALFQRVSRLCMFLILFASQ